MKKMIAAVLMLLMLCGCGRTGPMVSPDPEPPTVQESYRDVNPLISIFAGQRLERFNIDECGRDDMIELLRRYMKACHPELVGEDALDAGGMLYETVGFEDMNKAAAELFGREFDKETMGDYIVSRYSGDVIYAVYENDRFFFYPEAGEARTRFAAAEEINRSDDGNIKVTFSIYGLDRDAIAAGAFVDDYFDLSAAEAASDEKLNRRGSGEAVLKPAGDKQYTLVSFAAEYK